MFYKRQKILPKTFSGLKISKGNVAKIIFFDLEVVENIFDSDFVYPI